VDGLQSNPAQMLQRLQLIDEVCLHGAQAVNFGRTSMDFRMLRSLVIIAVVSVSAAAIGCGGSEDNPAGPSQTTSSGGGGTQSGGAGAAPAGTGTLTVGIKDSPFNDAKAVLVTFKEVSVHRAETGWETVAFAGGATARTCDLKQLQTATDVLGVATLPAGHYTQIRLTVESAALYFENAAGAGPCASTIEAPDGSTAALKIPSGTVKLNRQFTVASGGATTMLLDFDGDRSIKQTGGGNGNGNGNGNGGSGAPTASYSMSPVIRVDSVQ
jgi:hypothetical protein